MNHNLPARPNLDHLRQQAKALLASLRAEEPTAIQEFAVHLPEAASLSNDEVTAKGYRLADAQSVIARKTGFASWPALARHVEQLRSLEGTWSFTFLEVDGNEIPVGALSNSRLLIDGDRFRMESPEGVYEGLFNIDVEANPHQIDIEFIEGPEAGNWSYGVFEFYRDELIFCIGLTGASRPLAFATSPGSGHALERLQRVSSDRPQAVEGGVAQPPGPEIPVVDESGFEVEMTPLLQRLEGEWTPVELVMDGKALPPMMLKMGSRNAEGNETKVVFGGQVMVHAKIRVDESVTPHSVDYFNLGGASKGQVTHGIMRWIEDDAQFCMAAAGDDRPSDFASGSGSRRTLSRWQKTV